MSKAEVREEVRKMAYRLMLESEKDEPDIKEIAAVGIDAQLLALEVEMT